MKPNYFIFLFICSLLVNLPTAFAQQQPPPGSNVSRQVELMGSQSREFAKSSELKKPEVQKRPEIEEPIAIQEGQEFPKKEVFIKEIGFSGNTVIPSNEIKKITAKFENRKVLLPELAQCSKEITALYRSKGYVTSQAYLPPQKIMEGKVEIRILEGKVADIKIQGEKHFTKYGVKRLVHLKHGQVFKVQHLENSLVRINRNPDITARAVLAPAKEKEATDVVITVKDKFPMHAGHQWDNLGTKSSGTTRQNIIATHNDFLTLNDRMISRFVISEYHAFIGESASYSFPLDARGDTFNMNFSNSNLSLIGKVKQFEIRGRSTTFGPSFTFPLFMTPKWEGDFTSGFDISTIKSRILAHEVSDDELRVLRFGPNISQFDKWGRTVLTNQFSQGFSSFLGALEKKDDKASRPDTGGQFFSWSLGGARFNRFLFDSIVVVRGAMQITPDRLVSSEQFREGGMETVRGYPEGDYLGDKGYTGSFELRFPPYLIPKNFELFGQKPREQFQLVGFTDIGKSWLNKGLPGEQDEKWLMGIGGGVLVDLFNHFTARIYLAEAIGDGPSDGDTFRIHFVLNTEF
ncbi:MAG: ShlB/FhaC/HecB family hemolysin secretion/activation protein [Candidatus Omnitrophica bacterium]|nr:ShlB/FhaC/HecB family hemolysin secretion/activation protein [Candidatus Omnitrophota bacterium]